ncbi:hypothetical protein BY998_13629 [Methylobacterium sp. B4]|nr:hypothetical protein BY998_13629 [Methylobacterium sp. B4]
MPPAAAALLVAYPAWDAVANVIDARRSDGLAANPSQTLNAAASTVVTLAVAVALERHPIRLDRRRRSLRPRDSCGTPPLRSA